MPDDRLSARTTPQRPVDAGVPLAFDVLWLSPVDSELLAADALLDYFSELPADLVLRKTLRI